MPSDAATPAEIAAWNLLRFMADELVKLAGTPSAIVRASYMPARQASVVAQWLRALETWLRRLLLIAASRVALDPPRAQHKAQARRKASAQGISLASEDSADWRVSFALSARPPRQRMSRARRRAVPRRVHPCTALAMRLEALLRAAAEPAPLALRLARRLALDTNAPNRAFHQKIRNMGALEPYVRDATLLLLDAYPDAWQPMDSS